MKSGDDELHRYQLSEFWSKKRNGFKMLTVTSTTTATTLCPNEIQHYARCNHRTRSNLVIVPVLMV